MSQSLTATLGARIRTVPDFPRPGIQFKDITPLLADPESFATACAAMAEVWSGAGVTHVAAVESRGFLLGGPIALALGAGLIPVRKPGKLPAQRTREDYALEYGTDALEVHSDALRAGDRVLIVDDVLATGGTAAATCRLVERLGATVLGCGFLIELAFLNGRSQLPTRIERVLAY
ncbi:MAG: adenine phosphoribosyltransferase [Gemmatimonadaceae bacterium]|nr:adenine phosphoribosyltransferase [Gemmatimonadaceae bacterium]